MAYTILSESYGRRLPKITAEADSTDDLTALGTDYAEGSTCTVGGEDYVLDKVGGWVIPGSGGGGGGSDLPDVTSADNGNVLGVVGGEWDKMNPGYKITRQRFTLFENELLIGETVGGYFNYSFDELTRESDLPEMPLYSDICWIRLPDEFVQGVKDGKVNVGFQIDSEPMPASTDASYEYSTGGLETSDRVYLYLEAYYNELGKNPISIALQRGNSGLEAGAEYLDDSTDPALDDPDDYGWYFRARRSNAAVFSTVTSITEYSAALPETLRATVYLELVDVEFDPSYKEALADVAGYTPTPVLTFDLDSSGTPAWVLLCFDPDKADPDVFANSGSIPVLIRPENYYLANDPAVEGYSVESYPISGSLYESIDPDDEPVSIEISGAALVFITDPSDDYSLVAARLESYYAERYREQDPDTGEYGGWTEWNVGRNSITDLTTLTTYESTPLAPDGDDSGGGGDDIG